ncbi:MAG: selenoneine biosynthesis selenosugar synthase SenB [Gammaproteobacteria bacterium]|nr:selenoneine biosynthesis selenosugar synthase SenB [Gammaproteobacteria bacterium]
MKIILITPAKKQSKTGNRVTANRWERLLRGIGHSVTVQSDWDGTPGDMMVALHAWRSASSIEQFRERFPGHPLVVALTGTDIYRFQHSHPEETLRSMEMADALVCLHDLVYRAIPESHREKLHVIHQSAVPLKRSRRPSVRTFDVCVVGHLREEKDPFKAACAARTLPEQSRLRVIHLGKAHSDEWAEQARAEMKINPRYHWRGEVGAWQVRQQFLKAHALVHSSIMEGGANVISEALIADVPIIASDIDGNVGLLGKDYPGYYPVKDTGALCDLLQRVETDQNFLRRLHKHGNERKHLFAPELESRHWQALLDSL